VGKLLGAVPNDGYKGSAVPWYRVINSQGKISLPKGSEAFERQKGLLQEEQVIVNDDRIKLKEFQWQPDLQALLYELEY
jgi:methylated-DNA-protein-cysteine methyltransferase-like protein